MIGGALGVALSRIYRLSAKSFRLPVPIPIDINVSTDVRVLGFAVALSVLTGILFGLIPAWRARNPT